MGAVGQGGTRPLPVPSGCLYTFGQGVPEDHALALRLFRLAAEQGDADAQNNLGGMYAEGLGVAADAVEAYMWFELAASAG
jgi:TPR repeat protein